MLLNFRFVVGREVLLGHGLSCLGAVLDGLEVLPQRVLTRSLKDGGRFSGSDVILRRLIIIGARILELLLLPLLGRLVLLDPVQMVF